MITVNIRQLDGTWTATHCDDYVLAGREIRLFRKESRAGLLEVLPEESHLIASYWDICGVEIEEEET